MGFCSLLAASAHPGRREAVNRTVSWQRVKEVFAATRGLPQEEREAFLQTECAGDLALADEVRTLLGAEREVPGFLDTTAEAALGTLARPEPDLREPGDCIGPWILERRVGAGGMGTVWRCHRRDDPATPYAIKFMRRGLDTAILLHRFAMERRTLAALDHPNVAALVDAGVDSHDRPFLVMEFVEGEPLDRWCDRRKLGLRERVELFAQICAAVDHAHRSLVVHRDLKPANILVNEAGVPKLLDFGVARMLVEGSDQDTETAMAARLMTPRYASPEQLRGGHVGTASDVYSLGVVLYELLSGRIPFPRREGSVTEAREDAGAVPLRPSQVVDEATAEARSMKPEVHRRQLRGDLDTIVLMALRPEPTRRYPSAGYFAEDLERHFRRLPVRARGDSVPYLFTKWSRRHRNLVAMVLLVIGVTIGGVVGIARQAEIAHEEAQFARAESASRDRVVELLIGLFESATVDNANPADISVLDLVESGANLIEEGWGGEDGVRARLMTAIGRVFAHLGQPNRAEVLIERGLALRSALYGENHLEAAESLAALGQVRLAQKRLPEAEQLLRRALAIWSEVHGPEDLSSMWAASALGLVLMEEERFDEAEAQFQHALRVRVREYGPSSPSVLAVRSHIAAIRFRQKDYVAAAEVLQAILAEQTLPGRPEDLHLASTLNNLGLVLLRLDRAEEAERASARATEVRERLLPDGHPDLAASYNNLAVALYELRRFPEAADAFRAAANCTMKRHGRSHPGVALLRLQEARSLTNAERHSQANAVLTAALADAAAGLPADHPVILVLLETSGALQVELQQATRAVLTFEDLERRLMDSKDQDPWLLARARVGLATARLLQREVTRADAALQAALPVLAAEPDREPEVHEQADRLLKEIQRLRPREQ